MSYRAALSDVESLKERVLSLFKKDDMMLEEIEMETRSSFDAFIRGYQSLADAEESEHQSNW